MVEVVDKKVSRERGLIFEIFKQGLDFVLGGLSFMIGGLFRIKLYNKLSFGKVLCFFFILYIDNKYLFIYFFIILSIKIFDKCFY